MVPLTFISLFSGIGGLDLGLERAGLRCVAQVEIDEYACQVLAKHWPNVPRFRDIHTCGAANLPAADLIAGGFPCQDLSIAGAGAGLSGQRSGLWAEFARCVRALRPRYILVENVPALLHRGLDRVLGDLAAGGYDAEWQCLPAAAVGAPHRRDRLFLVAYARRERLACREAPPTLFSPAGLEEIHARGTSWGTARRGASGRVWLVSDTGTDRKPDGLPIWMDRVRTLGNAVVPAVAEYVGRCIVAHAGAEEEAA